jgi:hypothetical protein
VSAEDCWGIITHEIEALFRSWKVIDGCKKGAGRVFVAKAVILLAMAAKCPDADHLTNLVYDPAGIDAAALEADLAEARSSEAPAGARANPEPIPNHAFDVHTSEGRRQGATRRDFFKAEHAALKPRQRGLFDEDVENL